MGIQELLMMALQKQKQATPPAMPAAPPRQLPQPAEPAVQMNPQNANEFSFPGGQGTVAPYLPAEHLAEQAGASPEEIQQLLQLFMQQMGRR